MQPSRFENFRYQYVNLIKNYYNLELMNDSVNGKFVYKGQLLEKDSVKVQA